MKKAEIICKSFELYSKHNGNKKVVQLAKRFEKIIQQHGAAATAALVYALPKALVTTGGKLEDVMDFYHSADASDLAAMDNEEYWKNI